MNPVRNTMRYKKKKISNGVKIIIKNLQKKIPISPGRVKKTIRKVLSIEKRVKFAEVTVCFVSDRRMRAFNFKYLKKNKPTDVLAFDLGKGEGLSGVLTDIIISTDAAFRNAARFKTTALYETYLYLVHGLLHISGYDHKSKRQELIMRRKEQFYLGADVFWKICQ